MVSILACNFLPRRRVEQATKEFGKRFSKRQTVIDLGCGDKPYRQYFNCKYIGVDPFPGTKSDIQADAWQVPLADGSADGIILNQSLEHIPRTQETIKEVKRLLKPGGFVLVTVPFAMRVHNPPVAISEAPIKDIPPEVATFWKDDYWRFTKFGLLYLFRDLQPVFLRETRTTIPTLIQHVNYLIGALGLGVLPAPIYLINNIVAELFDSGFYLLSRLPHPFFRKFDELVIRGLTLDYVYIGRKKAN